MEDVVAVPQEVCVFVGIGIETNPAFEFLLDIFRYWGLELLVLKSWLRDLLHWLAA